jgi:hypothetical protein
MGDLSPGPRRLVELARGAYAPPPGAKAETRHALAAKLAGVALATATVASPQVVAAGSVVAGTGKVLVVSLALAGASVGVYYGHERWTRSEPSAVASGVSRRALGRAPGRPSAASAPADRVTCTEVGTEPSARFPCAPSMDSAERGAPRALPTPAQGPSAAVKVLRAAGGDVLERETALLRDVHTALREQDPARALAPPLGWDGGRATRRRAARCSSRRGGQRGSGPPSP